MSGIIFYEEVPPLHERSAVDLVSFGELWTVLPGGEPKLLLTREAVLRRGVLQMRAQPVLVLERAASLSIAGHVRSHTPAAKWLHLSHALQKRSTIPDAGVGLRGGRFATDAGVGLRGGRFAWRSPCHPATLAAQLT